MLFSIIVPVYNVSEYLDECLQSILDQALEIKDGCEVILIDDGSTDSSGEICDRYKINYPDIIRVFHNSNSGLLLTRRFGYKKAIGDYIINCDSDDILEKEALESIKSVILSYDRPDMIIFNYYYYDGKAKALAFENIFTNDKIKCVSKADVLREFMLGNSIVSMCVVSYKRECIVNERDYTYYRNISNGEDSLQKLELFDKAETYVYLNKALYSYRMGSGMTRKFDPNYYFAFKTVIKQVEQRKEQWDLPDFNRLFAIKTLAVSGRAITQSRYHKWKDIKSHVRYLKSVGEDNLFNEEVKTVMSVGKYLQADYVVLVVLLKMKMYIIIVVLLKIKNFIENIKSN